MRIRLPQRYPLLRAILCTALCLNSTLTLANISSTPAPNETVVQAVTQGFASLENVLEELLGQSGGSDTIDGWGRVFSVFKTMFQVNLIATVNDGTNAKADGSDPSKTTIASPSSNNALLAGLNLNAAPKIPSGAKLTFSGGGIPAPTFNLFGGFSNAGASVPNNMYKTLAAMNKRTQFLGTDIPYNPATGFSHRVDIGTSQKKLSFDSLITGAPEGQDFLAVLLDPEHLPMSIQDYIFQRYQELPKNFESKKKDTTALVNHGQLVPKLQAYQNKRRRFIAMQDVAISNLNAVSKLSGNEITPRLLSLINEHDWATASNVTLARLNLITSLMIADELAKKRELDQRMLAAMSVLLLQNTESMKTSLAVSTDGSGDIKTVTNYIDHTYKLPSIKKTNIPAAAQSK